METILEEIIVHFRPEPEEELHSAVHALLIKCFQVCFQDRYEEWKENAGFRFLRRFCSRGMLYVGHS